jgi:glycerophosphoryl diester phosphodiesterase
MAKGSKEVLESIKIEFAGHRGFGANQVQESRLEVLRFPENSLVSLKKVMESGADFLEFDLYLSQDKRLMVIHDNDLSINTTYIVRKANEMRRPEGGFYAVGERVKFPAGRTFVHAFPQADLQTMFDISQGIKPLDGIDPKTYQKIPELHEVLEIVSIECQCQARMGQ